MAPIFGIRELLWPLLKSTNFPKISDIRYQEGKYSKFFLWTHNLTAINGIIAGGDIVIGKNY